MLMLTGFPGGAKTRSLTPEEIRRYGTIGAIVLVLIVLGVTSIYQVEADEVAVVQRFGRYTRTEPPGLHFKLPFGIEKQIPDKRIVAPARNEKYSA